MPSILGSGAYEAYTAPSDGCYPIEILLGDQTIVQSEGVTGDNSFTTHSLRAMFRQMEDHGSVEHKVFANSACALKSAYALLSVRDRARCLPGQLHEG
jgi:hypothetical protein